ncbi:MAG: antibiotic biosynthesis monooxygenase family protein [Actinomycetes bacterium]
MSEWVVVMRFRVPADGVEGFRAQAAAVARLLGGAVGCEGVQVVRASDDSALWAMVAQWHSVGSYRKALSSYEVKVGAVPFLAKAIDEPTAFEVLFAVDAKGESETSGDLAGDAQTIDRSR